MKSRDHVAGESNLSTNPLMIIKVVGLREARTADVARELLDAGVERLVWPKAWITRKFATTNVTSESKSLLSKELNVKFILCVLTACSPDCPSALAVWLAQIQSNVGRRCLDSLTVYCSGTRDCVVSGDYIFVQTAPTSSRYLPNDASIRVCVWRRERERGDT
jgi:hypothetical protein